MSLLTIRNLSVRYPGAATQAVRDASFTLEAGGSLGIVGESGSGKSSIAGAILNFLGADTRIDGQILFEGTDLVPMPARQRRPILGRRIGSVFQDPFTALNPALRIGAQIAEPMIRHLRMPKPEAAARAVALLHDMGMQRPAEVAQAFPHQLSGGMKQRALIAAALACDPPLLILDEPTTALDVTVEAQILQLLARLREQKRIALLFISHNLGIVRKLCDNVAVMYASQLVELGDARRVLDRPLHPYSKGLLASRPPLEAASRGSRLPSIPGQMPQYPAPEQGCVFLARCAFADPASGCATPQSLATAEDGHAVRCWQANRLGPWPRLREMLSHGPTFTAGDALLNITDLRKSYAGGRSWQLGWKRGPVLRRRAAQVPAVNGISLSVSPGEVLGLVGESGCGKSTTGRLALRLTEPSGGSVEFDGADLALMAPATLQAFRRQAQIVFQNVGSSLNPRLSVGEALERPLALFDLVPAEQRRARVEELLEMVRLPRDYRTRYPHQLSGGERQRVAIARALATEPRFVVCDEPVSALDVSVQAAIVNLLADLRDRFGLAYLFISHDLAVVAQLSDRIAVMYRGTICETGPAAEVLRPPWHPYTRMLLDAVAEEIDPAVEPPAPQAAHGSGGCVFAARCPHHLGAICDREAPPLKPMGGGLSIACHLDLPPVAPVRNSTSPDAVTVR
ncbi:MAG: ABC transporter ATP-binding protein [Rhodospirillales bacterium]|nr:ABC transporter ATP-binding protein [Rhodospirillales bacterium]